MSSMSLASPRISGLRLSGLRRLAKSKLPPPLRRALRELLNEWRIHRLHEASVKAAATLNGLAPLRLNLASGYRPKFGWVNVDLFAPQADLRLDLRRPMPFVDGQASHIYTEHFFEHLCHPSLADSNAWALESDGRPSDALSFLRECRRVLMPGGRLEIVVPDAELILTEYVNRHRDGFPANPWWGPTWCDTPMHCVNYVFRQGREHKYAYDGETLTRLLESTGFVDVTRRGFDPEMDAPNHELGSLCLFAHKPESSAGRP